MRNRTKTIVICYTAIDECSRMRCLGACPEQSAYTSADFLMHRLEWFKRRGVKVDCAQTERSRANNLPMRPLRWHLPRTSSLPSLSNMDCHPTAPKRRIWTDAPAHGKMDRKSFHLEECV